MNEYRLTRRRAKGGNEMNIGIRLHDTVPGTLEERLGYAKAQGFSCAHLAMSKAIQGFSMDRAPELFTDELAAQVKTAFAEKQMDCAVLGCYLNLANVHERRPRKSITPICASPGKSTRAW